MKITDAVATIRFCVEYDERETADLRRIGQLPPVGSPTAQMWLTLEEIEFSEENVLRTGTHDEIKQRINEALKGANILMIDNRSNTERGQ